MPTPTSSNPFHQPARQWQIRVPAQESHVPAIEEAFSDLALSVSSYELNEQAKAWMVEIVTDVPPEKADLPTRMALVSGLLGIPTPICEAGPLEKKDWVSEVERSFPPLLVDRFYVYGSHIADKPPAGKIALKISAGAAFGSGEHATTSSCLRALTLLARRRRFKHSIDMGCGSGILAIAMAKLWPAAVLGVDIDPVSVSVARENAVLNRVQRQVRFAAGDGYHAAPARQGAPFDLIVANILARPLVRMAPLLARNLAPGGNVVLSGLLQSQERMVLTAHRAQGLRLIARIVWNGWSTLILG
jgi:ribosomal protein L11 methyltransferase